MQHLTPLARGNMGHIAANPPHLHCQSATRELRSPFTFLFQDSGLILQVEGQCLVLSSEHQSPFPCFQQLTEGCGSTLQGGETRKAARGTSTAYQAHIVKGAFLHPPRRCLGVMIFLEMEELLLAAIWISCVTQTSLIS